MKRLELSGFKSFAKKTTLLFESPITAIVGPNGSGKSNVAEAFRWVLGEQSMKSLRGKRGEDLIWNGSDRETRASRAVATVVFDNGDRKLGIDFDEVAVTREVHRDGANDYKINGSPVRLRDVLEMLANISLGSSGHHIVSQGDADRILTASPEERKAMVEDALGLKVYQWKLTESRKKLERTEENKKQVESLRREIAPHLKFLKKQVEKIEKAAEFRRELKNLYKEYLAREAGYLSVKSEELKRREEAPNLELKGLERQMAELENVINRARGDNRRRDETLIKKEEELTSLRNRKDELARSLGRLEGMMEAKSAPAQTAAAAVPAAAVRSLIDEVRDVIAEAESTTDLNLLRRALGAIKHRLQAFWADDLKIKSAEDDFNELEREYERLTTTLSRHEEVLSQAEAQYEELKRSLSTEREDAFAAERDLYTLRGRKTELAGELGRVEAERERWHLENEALKREVSEGAVLVDQEVKDFINEPNREVEPRAMQEGRRKEIERLKIKLEDMGLEGTDVLKEYEQAEERDKFLAQELTDLETSAASLVQIMKELEEDLETSFKQGLDKINIEFEKFFGLMFGGGQANLKLVLPEKRKKINVFDLLEVPTSDQLDSSVGNEDQKVGIDINISLPRKKVRGLQMLSGGERALTSIALLFAIAAVNPPPFLILDETDAALDEANSRKYGEMISRLGETSQLILITHNRETMSRAGILYGVTMGADSVSKLLSVRFDEAQSYAK
ncbi:MAG: AAA family ATPase [Candidatus Pacebacteria bacterium]|nr:AAA family ATPase [Candidatus Paceibacterota bacterium]